MSKTWKAILGVIATVLVVGFVATVIAGQLNIGASTNPLRSIRHINVAGLVVSSLMFWFFLALVISLPILLLPEPRYRTGEISKSQGTDSDDDLTEADIIAAMRRQGIQKLELPEEA